MGPYWLIQQTTKRIHQPNSTQAPAAPARADGATTRFVLPPVDEKDKSR